MYNTQLSLSRGDLYVGAPLSSGILIFKLGVARARASAAGECAHFLAAAARHPERTARGRCAAGGGAREDHPSSHSSAECDGVLVMENSLLAVVRERVPRLHIAVHSSAE